MNPIRSSLPSSSWLVATVVPWLTAVIASPDRPSEPSTLRTPLRKPSAGSAGVDGVFVVVVCPVSSSTATTSVNVPPVSMPMRTRRALMGTYLRAEIPAREGARLVAHPGAAGSVSPPPPPVRWSPPGVAPAPLVFFSPAAPAQAFTGAQIINRGWAGYVSRAARQGPGQVGRQRRPGGLPHRR